jgi:hypothetical protein
MNWSGTRLALKAMGTREGMVFNSSVFREVGRTVATCCPPIPRGHCRGDGGVIMETYSSQHEILGVDQVAPEDELTRESGQPGKLIVSRKGMRIVFSVLL